MFLYTYSEPTSGDGPRKLIKKQRQRKKERKKERKKDR
jgi:hypothetical protein